MENENEMIEHETEMSSAYNEAGLQIQRLHNLWLSAESSSVKRNHVSWSSVLDAIERELYPDIIKKQNSSELLNNLSKLKREYYSSLRHIKIGCMGTRMKGSNIGPAMISLDERHKLLKQIQESSGKGSIYRESDGEDMD